ncbi:hypothetical protein Mapa_008828 [Marchantia paleacea]|nr:hypothetical protein Mapa_008828 [Marchantia paleacea]
MVERKMMTNETWLLANRFTVIFTSDRDHKLVSFMPWSISRVASLEHVVLSLVSQLVSDRPAMLRTVAIQTV